MPSYNQNELRDPNGNNTRTTNKRYYYMDFLRFVNVIKWRMAEMRRKLEAEMRIVTIFLLSSHPSPLILIHCDRNSLQKDIHAHNAKKYSACSTCIIFSILCGAFSPVMRAMESLQIGLDLETRMGIMIACRGLTRRRSGFGRV